MLMPDVQFTLREPAHAVDIRVDVGNFYDSQTIIRGETDDGRAFVGRISGTGACVIVVHKKSAKHFIGLARRAGLGVGE